MGIGINHHLCYCDLTGEMQVVTSNGGTLLDACEMCDITSTVPFTPENAVAAFASLYKKILQPKEPSPMSMTSTDKPRSIFETINNTADLASTLYIRLVELEERMYGTRIKDEKLTTAEPMPDARQARAFIQLDTISGVLSRAHDLVARLEHL